MTGTNFYFKLPKLIRGGDFLQLGTRIFWCVRTKKVRLDEGAQILFLRKSKRPLVQ